MRLICFIILSFCVFVNSAFAGGAGGSWGKETKEPMANFSLIAGNYKVQSPIPYNQFNHTEVCAKYVDYLGQNERDQYPNIFPFDKIGYKVRFSKLIAKGSNTEEYECGYYNPFGDNGHLNEEPIDEYFGTELKRYTVTITCPYEGYNFDSKTKTCKKDKKEDDEVEKPLPTDGRCVLEKNGKKFFGETPEETCKNAEEVMTTAYGKGNPYGFKMVGVEKYSEFYNTVNYVCTYKTTKSVSTTVFKSIECKKEKDKPTEDKPTEDKPTEDKPTEDKPTEDKPTEDKPTEDKPTEDKPTEDKPTEDKPTEDNNKLTCGSNKFFKKVCDWFKWTKKEPKPQLDPKKENEVKIEDLKLPKIDKNKISYNKSCPNDIDFFLNVMGKNVALSLSLSPVCQFLQMLRPVVIGAGGVSAMFILMGINRRKEE